MKGTYEIPYQTIYLQAAGESRVGRIIKRQIQRKSNIEIVQTLSAAEATINILEEVSTRAVAVLSNVGSVDEYELIYTVRYKIALTQNSSSTVESEIVLRRKITHSDLDIAAKSNEEDVLINDMASEAATGILGRLSRTKI
ncbi:MAG: LPS assembly lipoprotein LptE [Burkholderiales bacterium]|nr:LPS assembly lipoprotein LptE [Burkholderiales bacterium]